MLASAVAYAPFFDGIVKGCFFVPDFYENFDIERGHINNDKINTQLVTAVNNLVDNFVIETKQAI